MTGDDGDAPRIVVTVAAVADGNGLAVARNRLYLAAVERQGGIAAPLDTRTPAAVRDRALATMDGLLMTGGVDIDPGRYGQALDGALDVDPERDALEALAWDAAAERSAPVLGICRGLQAINVFSGGTLLQHVDGHAGPGWGTGPATTHPIRLVPETRLATVLGPERTLVVNAYHHQGIRARDLAPGLRASAWAESTAGELIEGLEGTSSRFVVGVQCHPEREESTPAAFERLFAAFVDAARARPRR